MILDHSNKEELKKRLTYEQFCVTQECATEPPFNNEFWDHHEEGVYVDVISGDALFSSLDKFDSETGWPSFTRPIDEENIFTRSDYSLGIRRVEVRGTKSEAHLGHVFDDGPGPTNKRYCINSAALRFVSSKDLDKEAQLGKYKPLFKKYYKEKFFRH